MFDARHHVSPQPSSQPGTHSAGEHWVLAVALLGAAPGRMAEQVHADGARVVGPRRTGLHAHSLPDPLFEIGLPRRGAGDRHRERRGVADDDPARAVAEPDTRDAEARQRTPGQGHCVELLDHLHQITHRGVAIEQPQQLQSVSCAMSRSAASSAVLSPARNCLTASSKVKAAVCAPDVDIVTGFPSHRLYQSGSWYLPIGDYASTSCGCGMPSATTSFDDATHRGES